MSDEILQFSFLVGVILVAATIIIRSILQIVSIYKEPGIQHKMRCLRQSKQPWVTVIIDATGKSDGETERSLKSLEKTHYYNYDILLVKGIKLSKNKSMEVLRKAYLKSRRGAIVIVVTAGEVVEASFIKRAVATQDGHTGWRVVLGMAGVPKTSLGLTEIIQMLETDYWQIFRKAPVFQAQEFLNGRHNHRPGLIYSSARRDVIAIIIFIAIGLTAILAGKLILIWYVWLIVTAYGLGVIWLQQRQTLGNKLILTYSAPLALFILPVAGLVRELSRFTNTK